MEETAMEETALDPLLAGKDGAGASGVRGGGQGEHHLLSNLPKQDTQPVPLGPCRDHGEDLESRLQSSAPPRPVD